MQILLDKAGDKELWKFRDHELSSYAILKRKSDTQIELIKSGSFNEMINYFQQLTNSDTSTLVAYNSYKR